MKARASFYFTLTLISGVFAGWFTNAYFEAEARKAQSAMALISANDAAKLGDFDGAIVFAKYASFLTHGSTIAGLAEMQANEWTKKRMAKMSGCTSSASCAPGQQTCMATAAAKGTPFKDMRPK